MHRAGRVATAVLASEHQLEFHITILLTGNKKEILIDQ